MGDIVPYNPGWPRIGVVGCAAQAIKAIFLGNAIFRPPWHSRSLSLSPQSQGLLRHLWDSIATMVVIARKESTTIEEGQHFREVAQTARCIWRALNECGAEGTASSAWRPTVLDARLFLWHLPAALERHGSLAPFNTDFENRHSPEKKGFCQNNECRLSYLTHLFFTYDFLLPGDVLKTRQGPAAQPVAQALKHCLERTWFCGICVDMSVEQKPLRILFCQKKYLTARNDVYVFDRL